MVRRVVHTLALIAVATGAASGFAQDPGTEPSPVTGIFLMNSDDAGYRAVRAAGTASVRPEAFEHIVVFRSGVALFDRGLVDARDLAVQDRPGGKRTYVETGLVEDAWITEDRQTAVIARSSFILERRIETDRTFDPDDDKLVEAEVILEWFDLEHPTGRWDLNLGKGRLVDGVYLIEGGHGVAVMTSTSDNADFRVFGPDRVLLFEYDGLLPSSVDIRATPYGGTVVADLSFPQHRDLADRALAVVDLLHGGHWLYTWNYGTDLEPLRWVLNDDGTVTIVTASRETVYDRIGQPIDSRKHRR